MPSFPTATNPVVGDLVLVGPILNAATSSHPPGLYIVLSTGSAGAGPYAVAPADQSGNPTSPLPGTVPQNRIFSVYKSD